MEQSIATRGSLDGYNTVDTIENTNHLMGNIRNTSDYTNIDCSIDIHDQEFEFGISTGATGGDDDRHTTNQTANYPYNKIVRKSFKHHEKFLSINPFSKDYDSMTVKADNTEARTDRNRKHPYEKCNTNIFEEFK